MRARANATAVKVLETFSQDQDDSDDGFEDMQDEELGQGQKEQQ